MCGVCLCERERQTDLYVDVFRGQKIALDSWN